MTTSMFSLFFALLSLAAWACAAGVGVLAFALRGPQWDGIRYDVGRLALPLAWLIAAVTTAGSLYYSKVVGYPPCELCWYQRIAAYPLAVILAVAALRRDTGVRPYAVAVCIPGALFAAYHSWIQAFPPDSLTSFCTEDAPCTYPYVWEFGFVSLPLMALAAFVSIMALMGAAGWAAEPAPGDDRDGDDPGGETADPHLTEASP